MSSHRTIGGRMAGLLRDLAARVSGRGGPTFQNMATSLTGDGPSIRVAAEGAGNGSEPAVVILQDVQSFTFWVAMAEYFGRQGLCPVLVCYSDEDARTYAAALRRDLPWIVVRMADHYEHVVAGGDPALSDDILNAEIAKREAKHGVSILRGLALSDRHLGRDLSSGARGFPRSKISARRSRRMIQEACLLAFRCWEEVFARFQPVLVLAYAGGGGLAGRPPVLLARAQGIPFRNLTYSRFEKRFFWADNEFGTSFRFSAHHAATQPPEGREAGEDAIGNQVLTSASVVAALRKSEKLGHILARFPYIVAKHAYGQLRGYAKTRRGYYLHETMRSMLAVWRHRRWLDRHAALDLEAAGGRRIVYFALSVEPELTTTLLSEYASEQAYNWQWIASALPADAVLAVKEHPWCVGRRDLDFYRAILHHPAAILVHPDVSSPAIIRASAMVATGSSSVAYEAAAMGVPAVHAMTHSHLDGLPHVRRFRAIVDRDVIELLHASRERREEFRREGARFLAASLSFGFDIYWSGLNDRTKVTDALLEPVVTDLIASLADQSRPVPLRILETAGASAAA